MKDSFLAPASSFLLITLVLMTTACQSVGVTNSQSSLIYPVPHSENLVIDEVKEIAKDVHSNYKKPLIYEVPNSE